MASTLRHCVPVLALLIALPAHAADKMIERGRYLVKIGGCNDCHTAGYAASGGKIAERNWLMGDSLGWRGPWGTTYSANLRISLGKLTEAQWLEMAKTAQMRPPMPWFALRDMSNEDLSAIYRFVRHLGPGGEAAPAYVPPGVEPKTPFVLFPSPPK